MMIEEKWATEGPDWKDTLEPLAYADWLEERGEDVMAVTTRWIKSSGLWPSHYESGRPYPWTLWLAPEGNFFPEGGEVPRSIGCYLTGKIYPSFLVSPEAITKHVRGLDYPSAPEALNDVVRQAKHHPEVYRRVIHDHRRKLESERPQLV